MRENTHRFRPIYGDTDMMGVVYYANHLRFFEAGRTELLRGSGFDYRAFEAEGYALPVAEAHVKYLRPARYDELLSLTTRVVDVGSVRVRIEYELVRVADGVRIATGETSHACVGRDGRPTRLPDVLRAALERAPAGASEPGA